MTDLKYLYHATYLPLLESIKKTGLGGTTQTYWEDSKPGVVYLSTDKELQYLMLRLMRVYQRIG